MTLKFDGLPLPKFQYSPAVQMGPFVKTAGMVGLDPKAGMLVGGGASAELSQILANLQAFMASNELSHASLMSATLYVTAFHRFPEVNAVWDAFFVNCQSLPARTSVGVSQLPLKAQVEAEFLFYAPIVSSQGTAQSYE